jgi:CRISPR-associated protein Cas1
MPGRVIEITEAGRSLHRERGFLAVKSENTILGRVALDEIDAVLVSTPSMTWSNSALSALAEYGVPVLIIGPDFNPVSLFTTLVGVHDQGARIEAQAAASKPLRKRLWRDVVRAKILAQAAALDVVGGSSARLQLLSRQLQSGDPENLEAQAASFYWPALLGRDFTRSNPDKPANALLNYGYAVLRATMARAIVAAGLHPSLSLHHQSGGNGLRLADDLMEPFRPAIDLMVRDLILAGIQTVTLEAKRKLVTVIQADYETDCGRSPMSVVALALAQSLDGVFRKRRSKLVFPSSRLPVAAADDEE